MEKHKGYVKKPDIYFETSVFGFYFDNKEVNRSKREATRLLFKQIRLGFFRGYTGAITILELGRLKNDFLKDAIFKLLKDSYVEILELTETQRDEIHLLAEEYVLRGQIPKDKIDDAIHIATFVVRPKLEILVTWNCKHIANINIERKIRAITLDKGYEFNFRILTPEEVIIYEE